MRKMFLVLAVLVLVLVSSSTIVASQTTNYNKVGVKVGDRANYSTDYLSFDRLRLEVTEVTGVFVNLTYTHFWSNGTIVEAGWKRGNISRGDLAESLVCASLQAGDPPFQGSTDSFSNTVNMEVAGATRIVNELISGGQLRYYDQATGMLAKIVSPGRTNYTMISTNMWGFITDNIPVDQAILILLCGGAAVAAVVVAAVLVSKRGK